MGAATTARLSRVVGSHRTYLYLALLVGLLGCPANDVPESDRIANPPLGRVRTYGDQIAIEPAAGVDWHSLVDLSLFGLLRPKMTLEEATKAAGPPNQQTSTVRGTEYVFVQPKARVVLAFEKHGSTFGSYEGWFLRAFPNHLRVGEVFAPAVAAEIGPRKEVVLMKTSRDPTVRATVADGQVHSLEWVSE